MLYTMANMVVAANPSQGRTTRTGREWRVLYHFSLREPYRSGDRERPALSSCDKAGVWPQSPRGVGHQDTRLSFIGPPQHHEAQGRRRRSLTERGERAKFFVRAKMEHPFQTVKRQIGYDKVRYRGQARNRLRLALLLSFHNLLRGEKSWPPDGVSTRPKGVPEARTEPGSAP